MSCGVPTVACRPCVRWSWRTRQRAIICASLMLGAPDNGLSVSPRAHRRLKLGDTVPPTVTASRNMRQCSDSAMQRQPSKRTTGLSFLFYRKVMEFQKAGDREARHFWWNHFFTKDAGDHANTYTASSHADIRAGVCGRPHATRYGAIAPPHVSSSAAYAYALARGVMEVGS